MPLYAEGSSRLALAVPGAGACRRHATTPTLEHVCRKTHGVDWFYSFRARARATSRNRLVLARRAPRPTPHGDRRNDVPQGRAGPVPEFEAVLFAAPPQGELSVAIAAEPTSVSTSRWTNRDHSDARRRRREEYCSCCRSERADGKDRDDVAPSSPRSNIPGELAPPQRRGVGDAPADALRFS